MPNNMRFVAFLDVLGFSLLLKNNDIVYVHNLFEKVFKNLNSRDMSGESHIICGDEHSCTDDLSIQMISDSIVIWTKDTTKSSLSTLASACNNLLYSCLKEGLPLRGAISVGSFDVIQTYGALNISSVIGDAIIKAHNLEKRQNWMGCVVDQECFSFLNIGWEYVIDGPEHKAIKYDVPYKDSVNNDIALNWCNWLYEKDIKIIETMINSSFNKHSKGNDDLNTKEKIKNTIDYFKYVNENNLFVNDSIR